MKQTNTRPQRGFVLITALLFLVVLTLLALAGTASISSQTRIAANASSQQSAFETAEATLNLEQNNIIAGGTSCLTTTTNPSCKMSTVVGTTPVGCASTANTTAYLITITANQINKGTPIELQSLVFPGC